MKLLRTTHFRCGVILGRRWLHRRKAYVIWEGRGAQGSSRQLWPPVLTENKLSKSWLCLFKSLRFNVINNGEPPPPPPPAYMWKDKGQDCYLKGREEGRNTDFECFARGQKTTVETSSMGWQKVVGLWEGGFHLGPLHSRAPEFPYVQEEELDLDLRSINRNMFC